MKRKILALLLAVISICGCSNKSMRSDVETPVNVEEEHIEYRTLIIDENKEIYSYEDMEKDLEMLSLTYKDKVSLDIIGTTMDERNIYDMVIGDISSSKHIVIHASIHAREYITTRLVMKQLAYYLSCLDGGSGEYKNISYADLFENTAVHVIPMVNPDGVTLSQYGIDGLQTETAVNSVSDIVVSNGANVNTYDFTQWKANANGVDLNRNYDALWEEFDGAEKPSSDRYKGTSIASEPETKALIEITEKYPVMHTISYHTFGQVIYWYFGQTGGLYDETYSFVKEISEITGYMPDADFEKLDPAGYKDWALDKLGIPSITIEVGHGSNPVPNSQFEDIWNQNKDVWAGALYSLNELQTEKEEVADAENTMTVVNCDEWISLRVSPSTEAERIVTIPLGERVEFISTASNGFYKVSYNGHIGYALASYLK